MSLPTSVQSDVDELRSVATAYEALEARLTTLVRLWDRAGNDNLIPDDEIISDTLAGGAVKKTIRALDMRFTAPLEIVGEDTLTLISAAALP